MSAILSYLVCYLNQNKILSHPDILLRISVSQEYTIGKLKKKDKIKDTVVHESQICIPHAFQKCSLCSVCPNNLSSNLMFLLSVMLIPDKENYCTAQDRILKVECQHSGLESLVTETLSSPEKVP